MPEHTSDIYSNKVLIVLGMHRSGTSIFSCWLDKCTLMLGDYLLGSSFSNKSGHFEDLDFLHIHQQTLRDYNVADTGLIPPFDFELDDYHYKIFENNVNLKNSLKRQWGWKEPRTCIFVDYYRNLLPYAKYLIVFRDYTAVVESLIRRDHISINIEYFKLDKKDRKNQRKSFETKLAKLEALCNIYLKTWIVYNQKILNHINLINRNDFILVNYNRFIEMDKKIFDILIDWGFALDYYPLVSVFDLNKLNNSDPLEIVFDSGLEKQATSIKKQLLHLANKR